MEIKLRKEIAVYKRSVKTLSATLKETMEMRNHWESVAIKLVKSPNKQAESMQRFFENIEKYLHDNISVVNGKYILEPVAVKKLIELFPPAVQ